MPTPKKKETKTAEKAAPAKKKCCKTAAAKASVEAEAPAKKKCCKKKAEAAKEVTTPVAVEPAAPAKKKCCKKKAAAAEKATPAPAVVEEVAPAKKKCCKKKAATSAKVEEKAADKAAPKAEKKPVTKKPAPKSVATKKPAVPAPAPAKNEVPDEIAEAIAAARAELAANPEWEPFVKMQRQHLLDLRDRTLDSMSGVARDTLRNHPEGSEASGSGEHQADAGSDAYDRDFALSLLSKEQNGLYEIEQALERIDAGTYGICEMSYKVIPILRLEAIPFARLTVECQAQWEKERGKNERFRSRNILGFASGQNDVDLAVSLDDDEE